MAYTINYFYGKFLEQIDKEGSDFYPLSIVMEVLETETNNFIEEVLKYEENTQMLRDFLLPLYTPYKLTLLPNPVDTRELLATLPNDYRNLLTANVISTGVNVRKTSIKRKGEYDLHQLNPNTKATKEYPTVIQYQNYLAVYGPVQGEIRGFYLRKPQFGNQAGNLDIEIAVNLPDAALEKIMIKMASNIHAKAGDERYQLSHNQDKSYGHSNK